MEVILPHWLSELAGILILLFLFWLVSLSLKIRRLNRYFNVLKKSASKPSIERTVFETSERIDCLEKNVDKLAVDLKELSIKFNSAVTGVGLVKYNPFGSISGDLSFSLAIIDEMGNGVILTSLSSRDNSRLFCKPLTEYSCKIPLSEEEKMALEKARTC